MTQSNTMMAAIIGLLLLPAASAPAADLGSKDEPIKIAVDAWVGAQVSSHLVGQLLKKQGYQVEYINIQSQTQFTGLESGDISISPEVWAVFNPAAIEAEKAGRIVKVGDTGLRAFEGWYYPEFVAQLCPGIKSWKTINECADLLTTPDTAPKGRFIDYPADWGVQDRNPSKIEGLGLNYVAVPGGSEGATVAEVKRAIVTKEPVVFMFYAPNWIHSEIKLEKVEFPKWEPACDSDASWGPFPDRLHDCDWNSNYPITKWMWPGFKAKWPAAYDLFSKVQLTNEQQDQMSKSIDGQKLPIDQVVDSWLEANKDVWSGWVEN